MRYAIGIDIGGSKISCAVVEQNGRIVAQSRIPTDSTSGFTNGVERISAEIELLLQKSKLEILEISGVGVGCAGPVSPTRGTIDNPYTLPGWEGGNIVDAIKKRFGKAVFLENDADAAALGECFAGAGRGFDPVLLLTFGTGIGGAVVAQGKIYRGVSGEHPELGHIPITSVGPDCYCGIKGCFESIASGTAIGERGRNAGLGDAADVFRLYEQGQPDAQKIIAEVIQATASSVWAFAHTFLPQRIIFGGGIMDSHFPLFVEPVLKLLARGTMFPKGAISLARAELGNDAGLIGAASLAFESGIADVKAGAQ